MSEIPKNYDGLKPTKLHQKDFIDKYKEVKAKVIKQNPNVALNSPKINNEVYKQIGYPHWNAAKEAGKAGAPGFEAYNMNQGVPRKSSGRKKTNNAANNKRNVHNDLSNEHLDKQQLKRWNGLKTKFNSKGQQLDHINEIQETAPALETLNKWKKKGWITDVEYQKDKKLIQAASGNDPDTNAQGLTPKDNSYKRTQVAKKNEALKELEKKKLSSRFNLGKFRGKTFADIFAFNPNVNGNGNGNGNGYVNGGATDATAVAAARKSPLQLTQTATYLAQMAMRNIGLLNMVSEQLTKKKFTTHVTDTAKRGYDNYQLTVNNPEQRKEDIEQQQMKLSATQNYLKPYQDNLRETIDSTDISTL